MESSRLIVAIVLAPWILAIILGVVAFVMAFPPMRHRWASTIVGGVAVLYGLFLAASTFQPWNHIIPLDAMTFTPIVSGGIALWTFWKTKPANSLHNK